MRKFYILGFLIFFLSGILQGSNVRITSQPFVESWADPSQDPNTIRNNVAVIQMSATWDNSWRDDYNWDAIYVFLKCKKTSDLEWQHLWLRDAGHSVSDGFTWWMARDPGNKPHRSTGVFIHRKGNGDGTSEVDLKLSWLISNNGMTEGDFRNENVQMEAHIIEMVYVPKGPFVPGDQYSSNTYQKTYRQILPEWDVITPDISIQGKYYNQDPKMDYSLKNMVDRIDDSRSGGDADLHAWCSDVQGATQILFDFGQNNAKAIRYIAVEGANPSYVPSAWRVRARNRTNEAWKDLGAFSAADWVVKSSHTYPTTKALKLNNTTTKYRYYMLDVQTAASYLAIRNISMTEKDLETLTDDSYVIDGGGATVVFNNTMGLSERNTSPQTKALDAKFPTGFEGFYAMKYEISQMQYVSFLNSLNQTQQKLRTIGDEMENLNVGDYVYADGDRKTPKARNGIVVGDQKDTRYIFACNLDKTDGLNGSRDGQNIACNFLSPADMLAYASWSGLRPMSELEYEKMAREGWNSAEGKVYTPVRQEYAWGSTSVSLPTGDNFVNGTVGGATEQLSGANINAGTSVSGPVRVGSFANDAANRREAGSGYWGVMELSGNLAEIYYMALPNNQVLVDGLRSHGLGSLDANGNTVSMNEYWGNINIATLKNAFILRGGSFDQQLSYARISDRSQRQYYGQEGKEINTKEATTTFRLGYSMTYIQDVNNPAYYPKSHLIALNGQNTATGHINDTVCSGLSYFIEGTEFFKIAGGPLVQAPEGKIQYVWYISTKGGSSWRIIPGESGKDLTVSKDLLLNNSRDYRVVSIKRRAYTQTQFSETNRLNLYVVNNNLIFKDTVDTINSNNHVNGLLAETRFPGTVFTWYALGDKGKKLLQDANNYNPYYSSTHKAPVAGTASSASSYLSVVRDSFSTTGAVYVECEALIANKCRTSRKLKIMIKDRPTNGVLSNQMNRYICGEPIKDARDGEIYGTVLIGDQCWMAENLRYTGDNLPVKYSKMDPEGKILGALYNWNGKHATLFCPAGWRVPKNQDFTNLINYLNEDGYSEDGKKLKAGNYWYVRNTDVNMSVLDNRGNNSSGFGAMPAGHDISTAIGTTAYYITRDNYFYYLQYNSKNMVSSYYASSYYMSIRCILETTSVD